MSLQCHGYANGCNCHNCSTRSEGVSLGELFYDAAGKLRYKENERLSGAQAVVAFLRERDRLRAAERRAA